MKTFDEFYELTSAHEKTFSEEERRKSGIHYTSYEDIMKIVGPCIVDHWTEKKDPKHEDFLKYRVLDPACGCGNFLYVAFYELKKLEKKLFDKDEYSLSQLVGIEYDKKTAILCKKVLMEAFESKDSPFIFCADALALNWSKLASYKELLV